MLTSPGYYSMLVLWCLFALFAELLFWPVLIKAVRLLGGKEEQGRMFAFTIYGSLLDRTPGMGGYKQVFMVMIAFSVLGFFISSALVHKVNKKKQEKAVA